MRNNVARAPCWRDSQRHPWLADEGDCDIDDEEQQGCKKQRTSPQASCSHDFAPVLNGQKRTLRSCSCYFPSTCGGGKQIEAGNLATSMRKAGGTIAQELESSLYMRLLEVTSSKLS